MSLSDALADPRRRTAITDDALLETEEAVRSRRGPSGAAASLGLDTINRLRPGFLRRQIDDMLPRWAEAIDPWWQQGVASGDGVSALVDNAHDVAEALLGVTDLQAQQARDRTAVAVYQRLRPVASKRIAEQMPRIGIFVDRWASD